MCVYNACICYYYSICPCVCVHRCDIGRVSVGTRPHNRTVNTELLFFLQNLDWLDRGPALIREYKPLLLNLVSAHPYYLRACVRMLVKKFFPHGTYFAAHVPNVTSHCR